MAENSAIEWTDATVNFWWGCRKVGPGCDNCYAETLAKRFGIPNYEDSGYRRWIEGSIDLIRKLQRGAAKFHAKHGRRRRVFIQSMSDFFDNEVPDTWRARAWKEMVAAKDLDIQLVTKRIPNVAKMIFAAEGGAAHWPSHIGLIVTVVNQDEVNRDVPRLLELKRKARIPWVGLSIEPMQGPIDLHRIETKDFILCALSGAMLLSPALAKREPLEIMIPPRIDWVIVGGESGRNARPLHPWWIALLQEQCETYKVPFFLKQWGEWAPADFGPLEKVVPTQVVMPWGNGDRPDGFSGPPPAEMTRVGKKMAGRSLYGRTHDGFPRLAA